MKNEKRRMDIDMDEVGELLQKVINKIWKEKTILDEWDTGLINLIFTKVNKDVKNYREVTQMDTAYEVYANIVNEKLQREGEKKFKKDNLDSRKEEE